MDRRQSGFEERARLAARGSNGSPGDARDLWGKGAQYTEQIQGAEAAAISFPEFFDLLDQVAER